jgi:type IV pilus assembly protein PilX
MKPRSTPRLRHRQTGIVLVVALVALVAMTLAGIALMRSMDTSLVISGNLSFKQATLNTAERGTEQAIAWLQANASTMLATAPHSGDNLLWWDDATNAYYASYMDACDLTSNRTTPTNDDVNWKDAIFTGGTTPGTNCGMTGIAVTGMPSGYSASYVINRMCAQQGSKTISAMNCAPYLSSGDDLSQSTKNAVDYRHRGLPMMSGTFYRVTVRVLGPRNSVSYVQALVGL